MKNPSSKNMPSARVKQRPKARVTKTKKHQAAKVFSEAHEAAVEFLLVELKAALTFLHAVKAYSDQGHIEQGRARAAKAFYTVLEQLPKIQPSNEQKKWIQEKLKEIRKYLVRSLKFRPPSGTN